MKHTEVALPMTEFSPEDSDPWRDELVSVEKPAANNWRDADRPALRSH